MIGPTPMYWLEAGVAEACAFLLPLGILVLSRCLHSRARIIQAVKYSMVLLTMIWLPLTILSIAVFSYADSSSVEEIGEAVNIVWGIPLFLLSSAIGVVAGAVPVERKASGLKGAIAWMLLGAMLNGATFLIVSRPLFDQMTSAHAASNRRNAAAEVDAQAIGYLDSLGVPYPSVWHVDYSHVCDSPPVNPKYAGYPLDLLANCEVRYQFLRPDKLARRELLRQLASMGFTVQQRIGKINSIEDPDLFARGPNCCATYQFLSNGVTVRVYVTYGPQVADHLEASGEFAPPK